MLSISINKTVEIAYEIESYPMYVFGKDKALYNRRTGRKLRHTINGGRQGWWIQRRFMSHGNLRPLLRKPTRVICPF